MEKNFQRFLKSLGPGILFASTAIGVSHLVQSTRAGALYGFGLLWAVLLANLFKWPFFEYGSRYAQTTGQSLIDGYYKMGRWMLNLYLLVTIGSMFFVAAAVGAVTSGFMDKLFGLSAIFGPESKSYTTAFLFAICITILLFGKFKLLNKLIKIVGTVLLFSTLAAVIIAIYKGPVIANEPLIANFNFNVKSTSFTFLIALMGWMPTAVDLSTWNSLWTLERVKSMSFTPKLKEVLREFNFGYLISALLAPCFMLLGAYMLFGTGKQLPNDAAGFASGIIGLYTENIGAWSQILITASAFSIMFGTCLGVFDGYSRSMERVFEILRKSANESKTEKLKFSSNSKFYNLTLVSVGIGAYLLIVQFGGSLKFLVDIATIISFVIAPLIAIVNFRLVMANDFPEDAKPQKWMQIISYLGILFLVGFTVVYLISLA